MNFDTFARPQAGEFIISQSVSNFTVSPRAREARAQSHGGSKLASLFPCLLVPVKRHRGEPGHTRDTRDTRTNLTTIHSNRNPTTQTRTKTGTVLYRVLKVISPWSR